MQYAIFDIDNCLSNDAWRIERIAWHIKDGDRRYDEYHALSPFDEPDNNNCQILDLHRRAGHGIIFSTGRPVTSHVATVECMRRHVRGQSTDIFLMRNVGDYRRSAALKRLHLASLMYHFDIPASDIVAAYDDRQDVVDMWITAGIAAQRLWIHEVSAYDNPLTGASTEYEQQAHSG